MTLANRVTLLRCALIPVFLVCLASYTQGQDWLRYLALAAYAVASISDVVDGYIARRFNQRSRLGALLDPLADKLMINLAYVFLAVNGEFAAHVPYWFPAIILGRDVCISLGAYLINEFYRPFRTRPRVLGKATTACQNSTVIVILLELPIAPACLMITAAVTALSFVDYVYAGYKQAGTRTEQDGQAA